MTEQIDSYLLHGPCRLVGLTPDVRAASWAMAPIHDSGHAGIIGANNVTLEKL